MKRLTLTSADGRHRKPRRHCCPGGDHRQPAFCRPGQCWHLQPGCGDANRLITLPEVRISTSRFGGLHRRASVLDCRRLRSDVRNVSFLFTGTSSVGDARGCFPTPAAPGGAPPLAGIPVALSAHNPCQRHAGPADATVATSSSKAVLPLKAAYHKTGQAITQGTLWPAQLRCGSLPTRKSHSHADAS